jgi:hypothetical protein
MFRPARWACLAPMRSGPPSKESRPRFHQSMLFD